MAVQNYFTNNAVNVGEKVEPGANSHEVIRIVGACAPAAADDDGSTFLIAKSVPSSFRPTSITILTDGVTGGTDYDLGLYDPRNGAEVDKDILMDGQTMAAASRTLDGLKDVSVANIGARKTLAELLNLTPSTAKAAYDIVLTANTVGTAAGNIVVIINGFAA